MAAEHRTTPEEKAFWTLCKQETLGAPTCAIMAEAGAICYSCNLIRNYCCSEEEYDEALEKMRLLAAGLSDRDLGRLTDVARAAIAAGASVDSVDRETYAGFRIHPMDLHDYYTQIFRMLESTYWGEINERMDKRNPSKDIDDVPS